MHSAVCLQQVLARSLTHQQKMWPLPQSTACEKSLVMFGSWKPRKAGDMGLSHSGRRTARPQPGNGHHLIDGLLSTNACKNTHRTRGDVSVDTSFN